MREDDDVAKRKNGKCTGCHRAYMGGCSPWRNVWLAEGDHQRGTEILQGVGGRRHANAGP